MENKLGNAIVMISMVASVAITSVIATACSSSSGDSAGMGGASGTAGGSGGAGGGADAGYGPLYVKYGAAIPKVVDDAVAGVLADCVGDALLRGGRDRRPRQRRAHQELPAPAIHRGHGRARDLSGCQRRWAIPASTCSRFTTASGFPATSSTSS